MYAFTPGQTLCLVYEDFYLAIGYTFYEFINFVEDAYRRLQKIPCLLVIHNVKFTIYIPGTAKKGEFNGKK